MKKKILSLIGLMTLFFTQTGMIVGIATLQPIPIVIGAIGTGAFYISLIPYRTNHYGSSQPFPRKKCLLGVCCIVLGKTEKLIHSPIGPYPSKFASSLGVTVEDLHQYNVHFGLIERVYQDLVDVLVRIGGEIKKRHPDWDKINLADLSEISEELSRIPEVDQLAKQVGLTDANELLVLFQKDQLDFEDIQRIAKGLELKPIDTVILLRTGFHIKVTLEK